MSKDDGVTSVENHNYILSIAQLAVSRAMTRSEVTAAIGSSEETKKNQSDCLV